MRLEWRHKVFGHRPGDVTLEEDADRAKWLVDSGMCVPAEAADAPKPPAPPAEEEAD